MICCGLSDPIHSYPWGLLHWFLGQPASEATLEDVGNWITSTTSSWWYNHNKTKHTYIPCAFLYVTRILHSSSLFLALSKGNLNQLWPWQSQQVVASSLVLNGNVKEVWVNRQLFFRIITCEIYSILQATFVSVFSILISAMFSHARI